MSKVRNSRERIEEQTKKKTQTSELKKLQLDLDTKNILWKKIFVKELVCRQKRVQRRASQDRVQELNNTLSHFSKWTVSILGTERQSELKEIMHADSHWGRDETGSREEAKCKNRNQLMHTGLLPECNPLQRDNLKLVFSLVTKGKAYEFCWWHKARGHQTYELW